jgi:diguanylate cyclase (GGDEF)-like protein
MMPATDTPSDIPQRDRLLLICEGLANRRLAETLRRRYATWAVTSCETYLTAIAELSKRRARAVVAGVDASLQQIDNAVAGIREAAGQKAKFLLLCEPATEPLARRLLGHGANDYLVLPLVENELDEALGFARGPSEGVPPSTRSEPVASMAEFDRLGTLLHDLDTARVELLEQLASLIHSALPTRGVTIIVEGSVATSGDPVVKPSFYEELRVDDHVLGQITIGPPTGRGFTSSDVAKLKHYADLSGRLLQTASKHRKWREMALTDELSGLPNRRHFLMRLDEILERGEEERFPVTVLLFDIDDFKAYNDRYGHPTGDEIIRLTGKLFSEQCREQDVVARFGGDEFAVIFWDPEGPRMAGSKHPESALDVLDRVKEALHSQKFPMLGADGVGELTISGGLATYPWDGITSGELILKADEALMAAKQAGKNRIFLIGEASEAAGDDLPTRE